MRIPERPRLVITPIAPRPSPAPRKPMIRIPDPRTPIDRMVESMKPQEILRTRWQYWSDQMGRAIVQGNEPMEMRALGILQQIENEAVGLGMVERLTDSATDKYPVLSAVRAVRMTEVLVKDEKGWGWVDVAGAGETTAVGRAMIIGRTTTIPASLAWIDKRQLKCDVVEDRVEGVGIIGFKGGAEDMALGQRKGQPVTIPVGGSTATPISPIGSKEDLQGQSATPVSKAEQLRAMKRISVGAGGVGVAVAGKAAKTVPQIKPKKVRVMTQCLDGCGVEVAGRFAMGHDAKLKSLLAKIERGECDISEIPEIARPFVKFGAAQSMPTGQKNEKGEDLFMTVYPLLMAPVRFPGRDDVEYVQDLGNGK